jgi:hypothetical protein
LWFGGLSMLTTARHTLPEVGSSGWYDHKTYNVVGTTVRRGGPVKYYVKHFWLEYKLFRNALPVSLIGRLVVSRACLALGCGRQSPAIAANPASFRPSSGLPHGTLAP